MSDALFNQLVADVPQSARILKKEVLNFADFVSDIMQEHPDIYAGQQLMDIMFLREFFARIEPVDMINMFVKYVLPHAEQIRKHDVSYFADNIAELFQGLPEDRLQFIQDLLVNDKISAEDKQDMWSYWDTFVLLSEKYKKNK